ncbi:MAG TPA: type II toxin-antitoxin system PemK/MazF family toxin [Caulobacteraceae bacterium]|nr:type II toxin-antitoxin system PemK/MazF family toxin [Caulobacteraceae bacterium]
MPFEFGDVVLVPFPFTSQTASKQRPAVVISSRAYGLERPDLMLMAITSQLRPTPALGEVWLRHWQGAGLLKPSAVNGHRHPRTGPRHPPARRPASAGCCDCRRSRRVDGDPQA